MSRKYKVRAFEHQIGSPCRCSTIWNNVISYWGKCKANRIVNVSRDPNEMSKFVPQPFHICREKVQSQKLNLRTSNKLIALSLSTITYILQATILHISTSNPDAKYFWDKFSACHNFWKMLHSAALWNSEKVFFVLYGKPNEWKLMMPVTFAYHNFLPLWIQHNQHLSFATHFSQHSVEIT